MRSFCTGETSSIRFKVSHRSETADSVSESPFPENVSKMLFVLRSRPAKRGGNIPDPMGGHRADDKSKLMYVGDVSVSSRSLSSSYAMTLPNAGIAHDCGIRRASRLRVVLGGKVNEIDSPQRANQRSFRRPYSLVRKECLRQIEIRIHFLNFQVFRCVLGFMKSRVSCGLIAPQF